MATYGGDFRTLESDFHRRGIDTIAPGFYDHPAFLAAEREDNAFLNRYARFVDVRPYEADYLRRASAEIPVLAETLHHILVQDGRKGACVDMSGAISRILDREGFWNYSVKGSLTITFPPGSSIEPRYFRSVDTGNFVAGHAWVVAPPFLVLDVTLRQQPYKDKASEYIPDYVLATEAGTRPASVEDVYSPEALFPRGVHPAARKPSLRILDPNIAQFTRVFPPRVIHSGATTLDYIPVAIGMTEEDLEGLQYPFTGRYPKELYDSEVVPRLSALRAGGAAAGGGISP
jgi:hypothetical protein